MNPAFLDRMSWEMAEVYGAITDRILINLARYFPYMTAGHIPRSAFDYQAKMLAQMGKVNRESMQIIRDGLQGADKALARVLEQSIIDSIRKTEPELLDAVKAGIFKPAGIPIVAPNQMQAFSMYYHQAAQKLNLVNTVMLESTRQAYQATVSDVVSRVQATQTALDIGAGETLTGVSSWNMAIRHAIDRMKDNGITGFIDHAGRKWSAEAYAAMDIRTTVANTARAAVWEQNENFGNDLYIVSYHDGARPLCYPWQNKVISSLNQSRTVVDLDGNEIQVIAQSDTSYGDPGGLFGINCKHYPTPFIPGVSVLYDKNEIPSEKENKKLYEQTQQQRALERDLREKKRDLLIEKARGADKETLDALRSRCREASDEIDRFCDETGLPRRQNREGVFTKRDFPDADTYDVSAFERKQKERIERYFDRGGAQNGFTFRQMTPNEVTITAATPSVTGSGIVDQSSIRKDAIAKYADKIDEVERKRYNLIDSGSDDYVLSDKLYAELEKLEEKKRILEGGGWTIDQAKVVREHVTTHWGETIDADVYTMPDGMRFSFKHGMTKAHQSLTPEDLINRYYKAPEKLRNVAQKEIVVVDRYNPSDAYWRKQYKNFRHSYMTGGDTITIYRYDYEHNLDYLESSLRHEMGHGADKANAVDASTWFSGSQEWIDAMAKDKAFSGGIADSVSEYGKNSRSEDFAESVKKYTGSPGEFISAFPNRAAILERLIGVIK